MTELITVGFFILQIQIFSRVIFLKEPCILRVIVHHYLGLDFFLWVFKGEKLQRQLSIFLNLQFNGLQLDFTFGGYNFKIFFIATFIEDIDIFLCFFSFLCHSKNQVYPRMQIQRRMLTFKGGFHFEHEILNVVSPSWNIYIPNLFSMLVYS